MAGNRLLDMFGPEAQEAQANLLSKYLGLPPGGLRRSVIDDVTGKPVITSAPTGDVVQRSALLPLGITDEGRMTLAVPQAALGAYDAFMYPGQVARGEKGVFDPATGHVSQEAMDAANGIAGIAMTGSLPFGAPKGALRSFGGRNAATADLPALGKAQELAAGGADRHAIWDQTGWFKGADGQWRFEINDVPAFFKGAGPASKIAADRGAALGRAKGEATVGDTFHHPDLLKAYPELADARLRGFTAPENNRGAWDPGDLLDIDRKPSLMLNNALLGKDAKSTALHELQHGIQDTEGFAKGGNPVAFAERMPDAEAMSDAAVMAALVRRGTDPADAPSAFMNMLGRDPHPAARHLVMTNTPDEIAAMPSSPMEAYRRSAGEVEARNVQARMNMTPAERRMTPPWLTQDVADENQLLRFFASSPY